MNPHRIHKGLCDRILPLMGMGLVFLIIGLCFDFYYDLNDDVVIKDILSGAFSGLPDGHTNQLLYPLGWFISIGYRLMPQVPVYGLFLLGCFGLCFYLLGLRSIRFYDRLRGKLLVLLAETIVFLSLFLWELVYVQYSVVCGLLAGTACFWFYTTKHKLEAGEFWMANLPALLLVWLAFCLRTEMLLLLTPFLGVVGVYHWYEEVLGDEDVYQGAGKKRLHRRIFGKNNTLKYVTFPLALALGCLIFWGMDSLACRGADWKEYRQFFEVRTRVYDYTWYPEYDKNQDFYESIGVSREQMGLIDSYNFGLDPDIDANTLNKLASFDERAKIQGSLGLRVKNSLWEMGWRMVSPREAPYNYFLLTAYGLVIGLAVFKRDKSYLWRLPLLAAAHSISWMYLILAGRVVARIAHPLYFVECLCLLGLLTKQLQDRPLWNVERYYRRGVLSILAAVSVLSSMVMFPRVEKEQARREQVNAVIEEFRQYAAEHKDNYYLFDVYSTVDFSEKIFLQDSSLYKNYDLLGGWVFHSPLQRKKLDRYSGGDISLSEALRKKGFYFVAEQKGDVTPILDWYEAQGAAVELTRAEQIGKGENPLVIYRLTDRTEADS